MVGGVLIPAQLPYGDSLGHGSQIKKQQEGEWIRLTFGKHCDKCAECWNVSEFISGDKYWNYFTQCRWPSSFGLLITTSAKERLARDMVGRKKAQKHYFHSSNMVSVRGGCLAAADLHSDRTQPHGSTAWSLWTENILIPAWNIFFHSTFTVVCQTGVERVISHNQPLNLSKRLTEKKTENEKSNGNFKVDTQFYSPSSKPNPPFQERQLMAVSHTKSERHTPSFSL